MNTEQIRLELHRIAMLALFNSDSDVPDDVLTFAPTDLDTLHEVDETIYRLDMPDDGATAQIYGFYDEDGTLQYALAGVRGEAFTLIYDDTIGADKTTIDQI